HLASLRRIVAGGLVASVDVVAALGDRHVLFRMTMRWSDDVHGEVDREVLYVGRCTASGAILRCDSFEGHDLAPSIGCLVQRWAEDELTGAEQARALRTAASWARVEAINAGDWPRVAELVASDVVVVDHRASGVSIVGAAAYAEWVRAGSESSTDYRASVADVLAMTPDVALVRYMATGELNGSPFALPSYIVLVFDASGTTARIEMFDVEHLDVAWACFDRLGGAERRVRRVSPNLASRAVERMVEGWRAGNAELAASTMSPDLVARYHELHATYDGRDSSGSMDELVVLRPSIDLEVLATLGERHSLTRALIRWSAEGTTSEVTNLLVRRVDQRGLATLDETFAVTALGEALACLVERWAEDELDGAEQARALAMAPCLAMTNAINAGDWDVFRSFFADDVVLTTNGAAGYTARGATAATEWMRELVASATSFDVRLDDVLALTPQAVIGVASAAGEVAGGGVFALPTVIVMRFGTTGAVDRIDFFPSEQLDDAWSCFDRLGGTERPRRRYHRNLNAIAIERWREAVAAGDLDAVADLYHPDFVLEFHGLRAELDRADYVRHEREVVAGGIVDLEILATMGERHGLFRAAARWHDDVHGDVVRDRWAVGRCTSSGATIHLDYFESDDLGEALECLVVRYTEDELDDENEATRLRRFAATTRANALEWTDFESQFEDGFTYVDHRSGLAGNGAAGWRRVMQALTPGVDGYRLGVHDVLAVIPGASLLVFRSEGTVDGGPFVVDSLLAVVAGPTGGVQRLEAFAVDDVDAAWACFDEMIAQRPARRVRENLATAGVARRMRARLERDVEAFADLLAEDYVRVAHSLQTEFSRAEELDFAADSWDGAASVDWEVVASLGERHCLMSMRIAWGERGDDGAGEMQRHQVCRADAAGRIRHVDSFDDRDLGEALECLIVRFAEDEIDDDPEADRLRRFAATTSNQATAMNSGDWISFEADFEDDVTYAAHRDGLQGQGAASWRESVRALTVGVDGFRVAVSDVLAVEPGAAFVRWRAQGTVDGGPFDLDVLLLAIAGPTGRIQRLETFDPTRVDDAWARFDELIAEGAAPPVASTIGSNLASTATQRWLEAVRHRDVEALERCYAPGYRFETHVNLAAGPRDGIADMEHAIARAGASAAIDQL
ncbi:MAG TPA: nuclear transport factor 2 family protein, partial [Acidimicrobiales bacterium]|nr:nuclear transport factor 2 family protein [Acidimicrobiales bacterium]